MKPAIQFLELIVEKPNLIFNEYIIREENRKSGKLPIGYYLEGEPGETKIDFDEFANIINTECSKIINNIDIKPKKTVKKVIKRIIKKPINNLNILDDDFL